MGDQPVGRALPTQDNTNTEKTRVYIRASSGIRTQHRSVQAGGDISCFRMATLMGHIHLIYQYAYNFVLSRSPGPRETPGIRETYISTQSQVAFQCCQ
jgi:hypothetical protein